MFHFWARKLNFLALFSIVKSFLKQNLIISKMHKCIYSFITPMLRISKSIFYNPFRIPSHLQFPFISIRFDWNKFSISMPCILTLISSGKCFPQRKGNDREKSKIVWFILIFYKCTYDSYHKLWRMIEIGREREREKANRIKIFNDLENNAYIQFVSIDRWLLCLLHTQHNSIFLLLTSFQLP